MATTRRSRLIAAPPEAVWKLISDFHHMHRWWPDVERMEGVSEAQFTQVYRSKRGRSVRMDFQILGSEGPGTSGAFAGRLMWAQDLDGTPFQRVFGESVTEVVLEHNPGGTQVTIEQRQKLKGYSRTGTIQIRRATMRRLDGALDGIARAVVA